MDDTSTLPDREPALAGVAQQRRAARVDLSVEVGIDADTNFYVGFSENVSAGGLFVATYRLLPRGTEISLTFVLPDSTPLSVHGVVRWLRDPHDLESSDSPPGMGIEFVGLSAEHAERIQAYVEGRAPIFYPD